jgi:hypothetical protein
MSPGDEFTTDTLDAAGVQRCVLWRDASVGLTALLVIDDLSLGPGAGGVWSPSEVR